METKPNPEQIQVNFERRRYGRKTYCWASYTDETGTHELGDPWPGVNWPKRVLKAAIALDQARRAGNVVTEAEQAYIKAIRK